MSIFGTRKTTIAKNMSSSSSFRELKKQASFFLKEKIKSARLALTDVTPAQLLTEEATNEDPWSPDTRTMGLISRAAFEIDDYWRIVDILHDRLSRFDKNNWRISYKALILLEHLLTHGPESVAEEFETEKEIIREMEKFQYIDERGFNWGITIRNKSERVLRLLERGPLLKEERNRARKLSRGIEGFGSFSYRSSSTQSTTFRDPFSETYGIGRSCSDNKRFSLYSPEEGLSEMIKKQLNTSSVLEENNDKTGELTPEVEEWNSKRESTPLLDDRTDENKVGFSVEEDHPFINSELPSSKTKILLEG